MLQRSTRILLQRIASSRTVTTLAPARKVYTRPKSPLKPPTRTLAKPATTIASASGPASPPPAPEEPAATPAKEAVEDELFDPQDGELYDLPPDPAVTPSSRASAPTPTVSTSAFPTVLTSFPNGPPIATTPAVPSSTVAAGAGAGAGAGSGGGAVASGATYPMEISADQLDIDWSKSYHGLSSMPFSEKAADILMRPLLPNEIEIKPDGLLYLPEILYRRILNKAFRPGGWGMVPRGELTVLKGLVSREWGLLAGGRLVSIARGEQQFFSPEGLPTATEGCKSNALMRCCKDLGIASELWDPAFIRTFKTAHCVEAWTEHAMTKKKARRWRKKGNKFEFPLIETK